LNVSAAAASLDGWFLTINEQLDQVRIPNVTMQRTLSGDLRFRKDKTNVAAGSTPTSD